MMVSGRHSALRLVIEDLRRVFGERLDAIVAYGWRQHGPVPSLGLVRSLSIDDLSTCASRTAAWHRAGAATPLLLTPAEFARSLDAFPIEYGEIIASHEVVFGHDPFDGLTIRREDLRRACEVQAKSHLLHLREDYLEGGGRPSQIDALVRDSAPGFAGLLRHLARLEGVSLDTPGSVQNFATGRIGLDGDVVSNLLSLADPDGMPTTDTIKVFPGYLAAVERLAQFVDQWR